MFKRGSGARVPLGLALPAVALTALAMGCFGSVGRPPLDPKELEPRTALLRLHLESPSPSADSPAAPIEPYVQRLRHRLALAGMAHYTLQIRNGSEVVLQALSTNAYEAARVLWLATASGRLELRVEANPKQIDESAYPSRAPPGHGWHVQRTVYGQERPDGDRVLLADEPAWADGRVTKAVSARGADHDLILYLDEDAAAALARVTRAGRGRRLGMFLDGNLIAAPLMTTPITDGRARLSADFRKEEASDLAIVLQDGRLPAPVRVDEVKVESPDPAHAATAVR